MIFNHSEKDYQDLQKTNWENINYLNGKIEQLEKELAELQARKDSLDVEYIKLEKENTELDNANARLRESNFNLQKELNNQKFLNRQEVEKIFKDCREKPNIDIPQFHINAGNAITAICNLALSQVRTSPFADEQNVLLPQIDKVKITAILVGKILESNKDAIELADEIISAIGGK